MSHLLNQCMHICSRAPIADHLPHAITASASTTSARGNPGRCSALVQSAPTMRLPHPYVLSKDGHRNIYQVGLALNPTNWSGREDLNLRPPGPEP